MVGLLYKYYILYYINVKKKLIKSILNHKKMRKVSRQFLLVLLYPKFDFPAFGNVSFGMYKALMHHSSNKSSLNLANF